MGNKTALIFGSTGLIGNLLLEQLILSDLYKEIKIFTRQSAGISYPGVQELTVDFSAPASFLKQISGDDLYICLGTTIKKAGSVSSMEEIDRNLPVRLAAAAFANGVKRIAVVSSLGANPGSSNYYLRIKGEMEQEILKIDFENKAIVRPSILLGERKEKRRGELMGKVIIKSFKPLLIGKIKKYRGIHAKDVAKAMIALLQKDQVKCIYESDELQSMADVFNAGSVR
jgi:uncharacterized protein YbjT (DUF2867 family)